jgi:hypothetical protein
MRFLRCVAILCLLAASGGSAFAQTTPTAGWQVGHAEAAITPAPGEALLAGFGRPRQ